MIQENLTTTGKLLKTELDGLQSDRIRRYRLIYRVVSPNSVGQLIGRQKVYPARLRRTLSDLLGMRHKADYRSVSITPREARRAVERAQDFVQTIRAHVSP